MEQLAANIKDVLPIPENLDMTGTQPAPEVAYAIGQEPTASHALAMADHGEKGHAQISHDAEVKDLGWTEESEAIPNPLVGGIHNEELWLLIRRFNKQMYHVKESHFPVPGNLDLNIADEEEFSPDKLRATFERLYMTVGISAISAVKHIGRLRSWRETRRTAAFAATYFIAWFFDLLMPTISLVILTLIIYAPSREVLFPPAPLALVSAKTGGVQKPKAGVLGSTDSATGAAENYKGEAVEAEATNFVNGIASVALSSAAGKHPATDTDSDEAHAASDSNIPDPTALASSANAARINADGKGKAHHDKTKVPMETAIWNKMRPIMHGLADVADTWERLGNALDPTPPFPKDVYRFRLATVLVPLLAASIFISSYMFVKGLTFGIGAGFFSDPLMTPAINWLNTKVPNWQKMLELRNTLLKGVPTNAQLTITLLRIGEANKAPIPPPPSSLEPPPDEPVEVTEAHLRATGADWPLNATEEELQEAMAHDPNTKHETNGADIDAAKSKSHGKGSRVLAAFKAGVRGTVATALGADRLKASTGNQHARQRLGVILQEKDKEPSGPIDFKCRFNGKRGHAYISTVATIPCVSFSLDKDIGKTGILPDVEDELHPVWSVAVADISELRKIGGLGWKAKLVVGWALDREIADGLEIVDKTGGKHKLTAMVLRDELFNRLVAMGGQKWEAW